MDSVNGYWQIVVLTRDELGGTYEMVYIQEVEA